MRTRPPLLHTSSWRGAYLQPQGQLHPPFTEFLRHVDKPIPSKKDQKSNGTVGGGGMNEGKVPVMKRTKQNTGATKEVGHANGDGSVTQRLR
jgi:hypothetical protein